MVVVNQSGPLVGPSCNVIDFGPVVSEEMFGKQLLTGGLTDARTTG